MLGNGVVGILSESSNLWERRAPLCPSHCARLLHNGKGQSGVTRIIVQPSTKRIHHDAQYEDVGCEVSENLSECGLILGVKQPKLDVILPGRAYAFFSHTHKAQRENMPLLDKIIAQRSSLFDYELIVGDDGKRLLAFGKYAGIAGFIDFLHVLGQRYLHLGYSTPFLSLGASYMYSSLVAAKSAVIAVGEEIATLGLPSGICPLVFVFTGSGNVSQGAQEIFKLLPHIFVQPNRLSQIAMSDDIPAQSRTSRVFQVYGCIVTCEDMVSPRNLTQKFDKDDYYAHPEHYIPIFHERIAPYASVIVNCIYWEKRFPTLLSTVQFQELARKGSRLVGVSDITCDVGGSLEFVNQTTTIENPYFRFNPINNSYHHDMEGDGVICVAVDILPTEFAREASQHFGDILSQFVDSLACTKDLVKLPCHLRRACIVHEGSLTSLYEYIPRMRFTDLNVPLSSTNNFCERKKFSVLVSLSGHLFDQFLINEALNIIEAAGGSFHLVRCEVGQTADVMSYSELQVTADEQEVLNEIIDSLSSIAHPMDNNRVLNQESKISLKIGRMNGAKIETAITTKKRPAILILGAGRVCRAATKFLAMTGANSSHNFLRCMDSNGNDPMDIQIIVASLFLEDAIEATEGILNGKGVQLDAMNYISLTSYVRQVDVVISLLPPSCHATVATACIENQKHLVTASYIDDFMLGLDEQAKAAGITILGEMGLDPGIDHMMAMKMINQAHQRMGQIRSFTSYCGGLPSPDSANNPLAYKFSWNPVGAIKAGSNPATYKFMGKIVHVDGKDLYNSATRFRIPGLPAFALECLPNRNSLIYGDLYGISHEAITIFRATLRYEGFGEIMGNLAKIGFFDTKPHPMLIGGEHPSFCDFLKELLKMETNKSAEKIENSEGSMTEKEMIRRVLMLGCCKEGAAIVKTVETIRFLGFHEPEMIPITCKSPFDVTCFRMEERLSYSNEEKDMVLLHHEMVVDFPDGGEETHSATLLLFGKKKDEKTTTAMALTVGIPAAIGALLLLEQRITTRGILRPLEPEVYLQALDILEAHGMKLSEKIERS